MHGSLLKFLLIYFTLWWIQHLLLKAWETSCVCKRSLCWYKMWNSRTYFLFLIYFTFLPLFGDSVTNSMIRLNFYYIYMHCPSCSALNVSSKLPINCFILLMTLSWLLKLIFNSLSNSLNVGVYLFAGSCWHDENRRLWYTKTCQAYVLNGHIRIFFSILLFDTLSSSFSIIPISWFSRSWLKNESKFQLL